MYKKISTRFFLSLALTSLCLSAIAKEGDLAPLPPGAMYRYTNDAGRPVMTSILPKEAIYLGYEIIDSSGRLLEKHEKALPEAEREAANERRRQLEQDHALKKLYATPDDALRARDRQIDAIKLKISYAKNNIVQLNQRMSSEVSAAANFEQAGREVPETNQAAIAQLARQTKEQEKRITAFENDVEKLTTQFEPIIRRLSELSQTQPSASTP
jgi:chromosome segregation ATPase